MILVWYKRTGFFLTFGEQISLYFQLVPFFMLKTPVPVGITEELSPKVRMILTLNSKNNLTLTQTSARGYTWVLDILTELPEDLLREFLLLVQEKGYVPGKGVDASSDAIGLYRPLGEPVPAGTKRS